MKLAVEHLQFSYDTKKLINDLSFHVEKGEFVALIGPNGSGKSTILKQLYRVLTPDAGTAFLDGDNLFQMNHKKAAKKIGVVGQENNLTFDFTVEEMVTMGLTPHKKLFEADTKSDQVIVETALKQMGINHLAKKIYLQLSGGEKQRVLLARVLAQRTEFLILDEPTNHLDIHYILQIFDLVKSLQVTVLAAIHDLNIAALYADRLYILKDGEIVKAGKPVEVLTKELILEVYGVNVDVVIHPITKKVNITYLPESITY